MNYKLLNRQSVLGAAALAALGTIGCSDSGDGNGGDGNGSVTVLLEAEDTIIEGLDPGTEGESIQDGWTVRFSKYLVTVGDIDIALSTDESVEAEAGDVFVVDLTKIPAAGLDLWSLSGLREGRWEFNYSTPGAGDGSTRHETAEQGDYDAMVTNDLTYWIEGTITKDDGQSCPPASLASPGSATAAGMNSGGDPCYEATSISFALGVPAETSFGPCEIDEVPGFAIASGGTQTVAATIHGDHLFFNGFPEGDEGGVMRLAQWVADSDLNLDGTVDQAELEAIDPSVLNEVDDRYQLGGSPVTPLSTMWDFAIGQMKTQGHYQGEGECPVDGVGHSHD